MKPAIILAKRTLFLNGVKTDIMVNEDDMLSQVIRVQLGLTGTKVGCAVGQCGICSVILDGKVVRSCITKMKRVPEGARITTVEGIGTPEHPHPIQLAFAKTGAVQCGICGPGFVVSTKVLLDENPSPSRDDVRAWFMKHKNACRCTGYKPIVDGVMLAAAYLRGDAAESELYFNMPEDGRIFGTRYPRPTAMPKLTGTLPYGADMGLTMPPETLRLALVQAQVSHANILRIDTSEAKAMPGVVAVLTHKDVQGTNRINGLVAYPWSKTDGYDRPILCDRKVYQFGDAIAIVCAKTKREADAAAAKVHVEYELLPAYMSAPEAAASDAIEIHPGTPNVFFEQKTVKGEETAPIIAKAHKVVSGSYYTQRQPHLPLEPDVGFAYYDDEGRVTVHSKSISINMHRGMIADGLGLPLERLRIVQNNAGGTFGYKLSPTLEAFLAIAVMATGMPVFLEYTMYQQIVYTGKRSPWFMNVTMAADEQGKICALAYDHLIDHGAYSEFADLLTTKGGLLIGAGYNVPNIRGIGAVTFTNHAFGSAMRCFGAPQAFFAGESIVDELAEACGMDPFEFRYQNLYRPGDTTPTGCEPDVYCLTDLFDKLRPVYEEAKVKAKAHNALNAKRGVGVSLGIYCVGNDSADQSDMALELLPNGSVAVYNTWEDHGQGADIGLLATAQEALAPLKLRLDQIVPVSNDSHKCPDSGGAAGSRSQYMMGNALLDAAEKLMAAMKKPDGSFRSYGEMKAENIDTYYLGSFSNANLCTALDKETGQYKPFSVYMYTAFVSEVTVNTETGKVKVEKVTAAVDVGKIVNLLAVEGQLYGGIAQGIGLALSEDFEDIKRHTSLLRCGLPMIEDVPDDLDILYQETLRPSGPWGASGVGEVTLSSPHVSIVNAIYNACGARVRSLPARPEKVLAAMNKQG